MYTGEQLRRGANLVDGVDDVPPYFDSFAEYKEFCVQYRSKLSQIVRATAGWLPEQARTQCRDSQPYRHELQWTGTLLLSVFPPVLGN